MIDRFIDSLAAQLAGSRGVGPFNRYGAIVNVVICGALVGLTLWMGFTESPSSFGVAVVGIALEVLFVRIMIRAWRGDFDAM